ncbi:MAG: hypothetical protein WCF84_21250 [Anaerolineae bacterium]
MIRERKLTTEELQEIAEAGQEAVALIPALAEQPDSQAFVGTIHAFIDQARRTSYPADETEQMSIPLGACLGAVICHTANWEWTYVTLENGFQGYGVVPADRGYVLFPMSWVHALLARPERENNILKLVGLLRSGQLPSNKQKTYMQLG